jgi:hypothetical protein
MDKGALTNIYCLQGKRDSGGRLVNDTSLDKGKASKHYSKAREGG